MKKDKNTVVSAFFSKLELTIFGICFLIAFLINVYSIISYDRSWIELFSQIGIVLAITVALYIFLLIIRIIVYLISRVIHK